MSEPQEFLTFESLVDGLSEALNYDEGHAVTLITQLYERAQAQIDNRRLIFRTEAPGEPWQVMFVHPALGQAFKDWLESRRLELFPLPLYEGTDDFPTYAIRPKDL